MSSKPARDHAALLDLIDARMRTGFAWGKAAHDCISFSGAAVKAQTGENPLDRIPHTWTSARGAARVLRRFGGLAAAVDSALEPLAPAMAARGDIALVDTETGPALMVVEGETLVGPGPGGLERRPRADMRRAWSAV